MGDLLNLVGLTTGIVLYAMLLAMVVRLPERPTTLNVQDRLPLVTAVLGLTWYCCAISDAMLQVGRERGTGLLNIERRLECQYGLAASLLFTSSRNSGTTVEVRVPVGVWMDEQAVEVGG